jgi:hypothetical protein
MANFRLNLKIIGRISPLESAVSFIYEYLPARWGEAKVMQNAHTLTGNRTANRMIPDTRAQRTGFHQ